MQRKDFSSFQTEIIEFFHEIKNHQNGFFQVENFILYSFFQEVYIFIILLKQEEKFDIPLLLQRNIIE